MSPNLRIAFRFLTAKKRAMLMSLSCTVLGVAGGGLLRLGPLALAVEELRDIHEGGLARILSGPETMV